MSASIAHLDQSTFSEQIGASDRPVVVDFWAEWCGPCKAIAPVLEEIAVEHGDKVSIAKVNVDENQELAMRFNVMSIPSLVVFKDGQEVHRIVGAKTKAGYLQDLAEYL